VPQAVKGVLTDKWPAAKDYAESEPRLPGKITEEEAELQ
jgi:hypothetical protein